MELRRFSEEKKKKTVQETLSRSGLGALSGQENKVADKFVTREIKVLPVLPVVKKKKKAK